MFPYSTIFIYIKLWESDVWRDVLWLVSQSLRAEEGRSESEGRKPGDKREEGKAERQG